MKEDKIYKNTENARNRNEKNTKEAEGIWEKILKQSENYQNLEKRMRVSNIREKEKEIQEVLNIEILDSIRRLSSLGFVRGYVQADKTAQMKIKLKGKNSFSSKEIDGMQSVNSLLQQRYPGKQLADHVDRKYKFFVFLIFSGQERGEKDKAARKDKKLPRIEKRG